VPLNATEACPSCTRPLTDGRCWERTCMHGPPDQNKRGVPCEPVAAGAETKGRLVPSSETPAGPAGKGRGEAEGARALDDAIEPEPRALQNDTDCDGGAPEEGSSSPSSGAGRERVARVLKRTRATVDALLDRLEDKSRDGDW